MYKSLKALLSFQTNVESILAWTKNENIFHFYIRLHTTTKMRSEK